MEYNRTLLDIQGQLKTLYSGKDMMFGMLTCPNCKMMPISPLECIKCQQPICTSCLEKNKNQRLCLGCNQSNIETRPIHPFVQKAYEQAIFECPQKCGRKDLTFDQIMPHINKLCELRLVQCPFAGCGLTFNRFTVNKHKSECVHGMPLKCKKCEGQLSNDSEHDCF